MANLPQPPFWAPRPAEDYPWSGSPTVSGFHPLFTAPIKAPFYVFSGDVSSFWQGNPLDSYIAEASIGFTQFRSPGQVLQVDWSDQIDQQDDPPMWQGVPESSGTIRVSSLQGTTLSVKPQFFRAFVQDDPPQWQGSPSGTKTIWPLINQKFFGQGGQVPPFRANRTYDDSSYWVGKSFPVNVELYTPGTPHNPQPAMAPFYAPRPADDQREWQGQPARSRATLVFTQQKFYGAPGQVPTYQQKFIYDDPAEWVGKPIEKNVPISRVQGPRPLSVYDAQVNTYDDPAFWLGHAVSAPQQLLATKAPISLPFMSPLYVSTGGDGSAFWVGSPDAIPELLRQVTSGMGPSIHWSPDDPDEVALWSGSGVQANLKVLFIPPTPPALLNTSAPSLLIYNDDAAEWVGRPTTDRPMFDLMNPRMFGAPGQVPTKRWLPLYVQDDQAVWYMRTLMQNYELLHIPIIYPPGTTVAGFFNLRWGPAAFNFDVGDAAFWAGVPFSPNYGLTQPGPPVPPPVITAIFTVSGENVEQNFQEFFSGVSYTDAPVPKRTA